MERRHAMGVWDVLGRQRVLGRRHGGAIQRLILERQDEDASGIRLVGVKVH